MISVSEILPSTYLLQNLTLAGFSLSADPTKFMAVFFLLLEEEDTVLADPAALTTAEPASMQPLPPPPAP